MNAIVPSSDIGIANSTLSVADTEPRNSQQTIAVSTTASTSSMPISSTDSLMKSVVSNSTWIFMPGGRPFWMSSQAARTAFATLTALLPGCFKMPIACTGTPFMRARDVSSSKPSWMSATSPSRTTCVPDLRRMIWRRVSRSAASPSTSMPICRWPFVIWPPDDVTCCCLSAVVMSVTVVLVATSLSASTQMRTARSR